MIRYENNELYLEQCNLVELAERFQTPFYVYSLGIIESNFRDYLSNFPDALICYAVKANPNLSILQHLSSMGAGFDVVSGGELQRLKMVGADMSKVVFSGVGKSSEEINLALSYKIHCFNVESIPELVLIDQLAGEMQVKAPIGLRINPNIDAKTHPYISTGLQVNKFGIESDAAIDIFKMASTLPNLNLVGIDCHIGSQILDISPILQSLIHLLEMVSSLRDLGIEIQHIDLGGGVGVAYSDGESSPSISDFSQKVNELLSDKEIKLILEPGRSVIAEAGILITKINYIKTTSNKNFAIVDASMTELIRPTLYQAYHPVLNLQRSDNRPEMTVDIVGAVCESSDFLALDRQLRLYPGDFLAILQTGAYSMSMCSNYNSRLKPMEILVSENKARIINKRQLMDDYLKTELVCLQDISIGSVLSNLHKTEY